MKIEYNVYLYQYFIMCQMSHVRQLFQIQIDTAGGLNQMFLSYQNFEDDFSIIHLFFCLFKLCIKKVDSRN